jgi:hypothetical protein
MSLRVVPASVNRGGEPSQLSVRGTGPRTFIPVVLCLPEYSSGCDAHDRRGSRVGVHDVPRPASWIVGGGYRAASVKGGTLVIARLVVGCDTSKPSANSAWTRLRRRYVSVATTDLNNPKVGSHVHISSVATL